MASFCVKGALLFGLVWALPAQAQFRQYGEAVLSPANLVTSSDNALSIDNNPSALGFIPSWSLAYTRADGPASASFATRGDAVYLATPLFLGLSTGLSVQSIRPTTGSPEADRGLFVWALAFAPTQAFSIGTSIRYNVARQSPVDGLTAWDWSFSLRTSPYVIASLVAQDVLAPFGFTGTGLTVRSTYLLALAYRPFGSDALTLEMAAGVDTGGRTGLRPTLEMRVPYVGRLIASGEFSNVGGAQQELRAAAGLAVDWGHASVAGGAIAGDGFGDKAGWFMAASLEGATHKGIPGWHYVADLEVEGTLDEREMVRLVRAMDRLRSDDAAAGVLLRLRSTSIGLAYAQEIRQMIDVLQREGKIVLCHLDAAAGAEFYACAKAKRLLLDPAGGVRLMGPAMDVLSFGDLLARLGVRAEFVRIGKYKSAPEQWTRRRMSEPAREHRNAILDDSYARLQSDLSADLRRPRSEIRRLIDQGPYVAQEAVKARMVSGLADENDFDDSLRELWGRTYPRLKEPPLRRAHRWNGARRIAVIVVDGTIVDGENVDIPLVDIHLTGGKTVVEAIEKASSDPSVAVIVLRVDSPGGSAMASDQIWRAVVRAKKKKPVIASFGSVAASGGYYVAAAADEIWADPSTLTGSIGVYYGKADLAQLAQRLGVGVEQLKRGQRAGAESLWRPFSEDEKRVLGQKVEIWYTQFLERVAQGRKMSLEQVHALAQGRVWSGDAALKRGLVDHLGGFGAALARARQIAQLDRDAMITITPTRPEKLLDYLLGSSARREESDAGRPVKPGGKASLSLRLPREMRWALSAILAQQRTRTDVPMALLEEGAPPQ